MADSKLNNVASKTNANAKAFLVKDSETKGSGEEGWITKAQLSQIIRDEIKAQMSAITSGTPDVPVLDGNTLKYMTLANFAKVAGGLITTIPDSSDLDNYTSAGYYRVVNGTSAKTMANIPYTDGGGTLEVKKGINDNASLQFFYPNATTSYFFYRIVKTQTTAWVRIGAQD